MAQNNKHTFRKLEDLNLIDNFLFQEMLSLEGDGEALKNMLKYIEKTTDSNITNQDIAFIHNLVGKVKHKKEVGINYMKSWEVEEMARKSGLQEGRNKVNQLIIKLSEAGRTEDIVKAANDTKYQEQLFQEFNL